MKKIFILVTTLSMFMLTSTIYAVDNEQGGMPGMNSSMQKGGAMGQGNMDMMKMNMHEMMKQMDEIHSIKDPKKREQLMHAHMLNMQKGMQMMRSMGSDMMMTMMNNSKGNDAMMNKGMDGNMDCKGKGMRHQMMVERMDMMQMMMEQMMNRMSMQEGMMPDLK